MLHILSRCIQECGTKRLQIPKGQLEDVNRRRTDNAMEKTNKTKKTNNALQNTTQKTKDRGTRTLLKEIEDTKGVIIRTRQSKKDIYNGQMKKKRQMDKQ